MASGSRGWRIPLLLAGSATFLTLAVLGVVGEWAVRYRERTRTTAPGSMSMIFYRHSRLMHGLVRGIDYYGWVRVGRQGFRGAREVSVTPPPNVYRIIAVGGSTTFDGNTSGDSATWSSRLEQILDSAAAPLRFEVLNAGVPGFQVFDDLVRLESELYAYKPDLIILYQGHNDLFNTLSREPTSDSAAPFDPRPNEIPTVYPGQLWLERHSLLYHKLRSKFEAISFRSSGAALGAAVTPAARQKTLELGSQGFGRSVREYLAVAQSLKTRVLVPQVAFASKPAPGSGAAGETALTEMWQRATPFAPLPVMRQGYALYDSAARSAAADFGVTYVPVADSTMWAMDVYADGDPIHFNDKGSWKMARQLADVIRRLPDVDQRRRAATTN
jgi:lysophospholipase L1-like esterase